VLDKTPQISRAIYPGNGESLILSNPRFRNTVN
jgi:hypothetical protein